MRLCKAPPHTTTSAHPRHHPQPQPLRARTRHKKENVLRQCYPFLLLFIFPEFGAFRFFFFRIRESLDFLLKMRRSSASKKTGQSNSTPIAADLFRSASSKASSKESERIDSLFYSYANGSTGLIDPEGIETLCADMEVDHTDVRVLMLAWKMKAEEQGYFTLDEWRRGLKALRADTVSKLKKALPDLEKEVRRPSNFADFYSYAFQYCLTEEKQKSIDIESICELLTLVLGSTFPAQVNLFVEYLKTQNDYKVINMDQWMGFFRFCNEISFPTLNDYDSELAWPLILDNFVEWLREKQK
ncbi:hypothetical protein GLYMA_08G216700v4 [Glycine max]|nr:DCN1-like protein 5 [Glycine soja]XP_028244660.1 DCN1-like protein 5 [Glycine soja]KAG4399375.1 hypothetical protein GLYMA_08G216700v4 [Glycine max]KAG4399376.1 hypothetical protein GLYMA_08G216700v4 [Glycine max]KAG5026141.1 hypothetical protein JHK86_022055 [Glycine max]KAH1052427.1 hypothetical protein GYH30_021985 [Glycine max]KAH1052428.1 hypothetical protein GYH30_021985 [Glycine max]